MANLKGSIAASCALLALAHCTSATPQAKATLLPMNDPAIVYSPYNWAVTAKSAKTINAGAYFKTIFTGASVVITTDTSGMGRLYSQFWTRVDGGPLEQHILAPGNPSFTVSYSSTTISTPDASPQGHLLEVIVKSTSETISRWSPQEGAAIFTGIQLQEGQHVTAPRLKPFNILIYGDSITEGVRTLGYVGIQNDTDRNDAVRDYSYQLSLSLPTEIGIVAFGGSGFTHDGSGQVPPLIQSYNMLWKGQERTFDPKPDLVIYNEGTNDSGDISSDFVAVVKAVLAAAPKAKQLLLLPFNRGHKEIATVVSTIAKPNQVFFGNTTGFYSGEDGLHPFGYAHIAQIAPKMAELVFPLLVQGSQAVRSEL